MEYSHLLFLFYTQNQTQNQKTLDLEQTPDDKLYKALDYQP